MATFLAGEPARVLSGPGVSGTFGNRNSFRRTPICLHPSDSFVNPGGGCTPEDEGETDWPSLDASLTAEQQAHLGCGPFFGTRCDGSDDVAPFGQLPTSGLRVTHAEPSTLVQAWPRLQRVVTATSASLTQPGSVGRNPDTGVFQSFDGGPVATRRVKDPVTG